MMRPLMSMPAGSGMFFYRAHTFLQGKQFM